MKNIKTNNWTFKSFIFTFLISLLASCNSGPREYPNIPLDKLDSELKYTGGVIVDDIIMSFNHEKGARFLLDKRYTTPMVHGRIMKNLRLYNDTYTMIPLVIGKVSKHRLFQVVNKGIIKSMRYQLYTDNNMMKSIELTIDVNLDNKLADFYLYVTTKDGKTLRENVLPEFKK